MSRDAPQKAFGRETTAVAANRGARARRALADERLDDAAPRARRRRETGLDRIRAPKMADPRTHQGTCCDEDTAVAPHARRGHFAKRACGIACEHGTDGSCGSRRRSERSRPPSRVSCVFSGHSTRQVSTTGCSRHLHEMTTSFAVSTLAHAPADVLGRGERRGVPRALARTRLSPVLSDPARFRARVLLTEGGRDIRRGDRGVPVRRHTRLRRHAFRADAECSTRVDGQALRRHRGLRRFAEPARAHPGLDKDTPLAFGACPREADETETETKTKSRPCARAREAVLTSDNSSVPTVASTCAALPAYAGGPRGTCRARTYGSRTACSTTPARPARPTPPRRCRSVGETDVAAAAAAGGFEFWRNERTACRFEGDCENDDSNRRASSTYRVGSFLYRALREGRRFRRAGLRKTK